jgi:hypothetical protein
MTKNDSRDLKMKRWRPKANQMKELNSFIKKAKVLQIVDPRNAWLQLRLRL